MSGDYLWDRSGDVDQDVVRLERMLAVYRHRGVSGGAAGGPKHRRAGSILAAAALVAASLTLWLARERELESDGAIDLVSGPTPYSLERIEGRVDVFDARGRRVTLGGAATEDQDDAPLAPGSNVVCAADARARVRVSGVGSVVLENASSLRIDPAPTHDDDAGYLVHLDRGTMRATIFAAPRLFQVGTPSGIAVDLGCIYAATVRPDGSTLLAVETGAVSFEAAGHRVHVPSGAECVATPSRGPGTPVWSDQTEDLKRAVAALDLERSPTAELIERALRPDSPRSTLTLFHLLDHESQLVRNAALDRIVALVPDVATHDRGLLIRGDPDARASLRDALEGDW